MHRLLAKNFKVGPLWEKTYISHKDMYKHAPPGAIVDRLLEGAIPPFSKDNVFFVVMVKHPYSWLVSRMRLAKKTIEGNEGEALDRLKEYNLKYREWLRFLFCKPSCSILVRYEDLVKNYKAPLGILQAAFNLEMTGDSLENVRGVMRKNNTEDKGQLFDVNYYLKKFYLEEYPEQFKRPVYRAIDWGVVRELGYRDALRKDIWGSSDGDELFDGFAPPQF